MRCVLVLLLVAACEEPVVSQPWQLDHDRIIAVRLSPPVIHAGHRAWIDGLVALQGEPPRELVPDRVEPSSTSDELELGFEDGRWFVIASSELAAPVDLIVTFGELVARKIVAIDDGVIVPMIRDVHAGELEIGELETFAIAPQREIALHVAAGEDDKVMWLTSCGALVDHDLPDAFLTVEPRRVCELVVVLRAGAAVAWQTWKVTTER